jgi:KDO2-lipid IV(A) lauroyltransferase
VQKATGKRRARAKGKPVRHLFEYVGLRLIRVVMRVLPIDFASAFMGWLWRVIAPHLRRHPRVLAHLALAYPEMSKAERERIARDMWTNLGRVFAESFLVERILAKSRIDFRIAPLLAELHDAHEGVVFVSLHAGNWELAITPTLSAGIKAAGVYQRLKNPIVDRYLVESRRPYYPRGLFAKGTDIGRRLTRIVKEGGALAMLADLRDRRGVVVPFFGHPAPSTSFPALLCRISGAKIVAARVVRTRGARFIIDGEIIPMPRTADRDADVLEGTRRIQARFEDWIREHPEQWMWAHRRWN